MRLLALTVILLVSTGSAWAGSMSLGELLGTKASEMKGFYGLTWPSDEPRHAGGAYVPVNTLQTEDGEYQFLDWGLGVEEPQGSEDPRFVVPIMGNVVDIVRKAFGFRWAKAHIRSTKLPPIWMGPIFHPPTRLSKTGLKEYRLKHNVGIGLSIRISSLMTAPKED